MNHVGHMLVKASSVSLTEQLVQLIASRIQSHLLSPGSKLPSVRQCAQQHQLSPSTVVAAYDRLQAQGWIEARKNRGFFVREVLKNEAISPASTGNSHSTDSSSGAAVARHHQAPLNAGALVRGMFHRISDKPQPGMGVLPPAWLDNHFLASSVRHVMSKGVASFSYEYGEPHGDMGLRRALSGKLQQHQIHAEADQIITTIGATHALDIVSRTLLRAGDAVMVEEPGWAIEYARLASMGMKILPVPRGPMGPDLEIMKQYCEQHHPKLFVSLSVLHNPTGYCLTPSSAHALLTLAREKQFYIVEDDTYSPLANEHATRLCALDALQQTIYVGGFAKILAPNWRVGFLASPAHLTERFLETKMLSTLTTPSLLEKALAYCIEQGQLRRHTERIRTQLSAARNRSTQLALAHGCEFKAEPAGLFGWVDTGVDTDALSQRMLDEGYLLAPGALFHANRVPSTLMRINFATTQDLAFWQVFERLTEQMQERK